MDLPLQISLTPELIAAVQAGAGCVRFEDPETHRMYLLAEQYEAVLDDNYFREKLAEARHESEMGLSEPWDVEGLKAELRARYASRESE
ncbi:MAG: hypothetical protein SH868_08590 [Bythopirellula sp.]|nr:hypothetical protein [Bythopirellula sp.]